MKISNPAELNETQRESWSCPLGRTVPGERSRHFASIVTRDTFFASSQVVWRALVFYEEVLSQPPFLLRCLLPVPVRADGSKFEVGAEIRCQYIGGYLLKRVNQIIHLKKYSFDVIEQDLAFWGVALIGGDYMLHELSSDCTQVAVATRYHSPHRPRWICQRVEALLCHAFHRHILNAVRKTLGV